MLDPKDFSKVLFPAHAGVIHWLVFRRLYVCAFPRTRGGDPARQAEKKRRKHFSPHTRG